MNLARFVVAIATLAISSAALAGTGSEKSFFDLENCGNCKAMMAEEGLMEHMQWETHLLANGMMSVTTVDPAYEEAYARTCAVMGESMQKAMSGADADMEMCGFCDGMMELAQAGASMEKVDTAAGHVMLVTASDDAVIAQIRALGQRSIDEMAMMMKHEGDHAGHDH